MAASRVYAIEGNRLVGNVMTSKDLLPTNIVSIAVGLRKVRVTPEVAEQLKTLMNQRPPSRKYRLLHPADESIIGRVRRR